MNKKTLYCLSFVLLIVLLLSTSSPAFAASGQGVSLADVRFIPGKGVVFLFDLTGDFKQGDLQGRVIIHGNTYPLYCRFTDNGQASCTSTAMNQYAGQTAWIVFAGFSFTDVIPGERGCPFKAVAFHWPGEETWTFTVKPGDLADALSTKPPEVTIDAIYCSDNEYFFYGSGPL